jgi:uncharacterized membrane protein YecN with MAPEG domain
MNQFKISPKGINEIFKLSLQKTIPIYVVLLLVMLWVNFGRSQPNNNLNFNVGLIVMPIMVIALFVGGYLGWKRTKEQFKSYTLTITDTEIIRVQKNTPTITHLKSDISEIIKQHNGGFSIKKQSTNDMIGVPSQIEEYDKLEGILNQIIPVKINTSKSWQERFIIPITVINLVLMLCAMSSTNVYVVSISGTIVLIALIYSFIALNKNKNIDSRTRRFRYFIIFPMLSIIGRMILLLSAKNDVSDTQFLDKKEAINAETKAQNDDELIAEIDILLKKPSEEVKNAVDSVGGIELENLNESIKYLDKPDEIVLDFKEVELEIDYPLNEIYKGKLTTSNKGFTRKEFIVEISKRYHQIYEEEEATAKTKTIPREKRKGLINRNDTDGKYGIWGHDLSDLFMTGIDVYKTKEGKIVLRLGIDS